MVNTAQYSAQYSARHHVLLGLLTLAILIGGFGVWSVTANISGAIIAPGAIEVEQNRQVVQHPDGGVVASIAVREGQEVQAGNILIRLDSTQLRSDRKVTEGRLFEVLARRARLEAERDGRDDVTFGAQLSKLLPSRADVRALTEGQARLFTSRRDTMAAEIAKLEKRIGQIGNQIDGLGAQETAMQAQLDLLRTELGSQQILLEKRLTQAAKVLGLQREEASLLGRLGSLTAARAEHEGQITEIEIEILRLATLRREQAISELRDLGFSELELSEKLNGLDQRLERLDIRAPVSGIVHAMSVFAERAVIRPADPVLYIVPQDRLLLISAQLEPIHVDEVFVGQEVVVRFAAFDARTTPELAGHVVTISADTFVEERSQRRYYRVGIHLAEGALEKLPEGLTLIPGMPADAFIRTSDRTMLAYLVKPLADYFNKAFREN